MWRFKRGIDLARQWLLLASFLTASTNASFAPSSLNALRHPWPVLHAPTQFPVCSLIPSMLACSVHCFPCGGDLLDWGRILMMSYHPPFSTASAACFLERASKDNMAVGCNAAHADGLLLSPRFGRRGAPTVGGVDTSVEDRSFGISGSISISSCLLKTANGLWWGRTCYMQWVDLLQNSLGRQARKAVPTIMITKAATRKMATLKLLQAHNAWHGQRRESSNSGFNQKYVHPSLDGFILLF